MRRGLAACSAGLLLFLLWTLAPRDYVTYCQVWGLSGHTSPRVTCLDGLCNDRSLTNTDRKSSVTKLCLASTVTQPLTPTNTQTISLCLVTIFPFHHLYFPSDNNTVIYFLSLASDKQSLDLYQSPVAQHSTRSYNTSKTHRIKIYMHVSVIQLLKFNAQI